jgi:hypothetical protein
MGMATAKPIVSLYRRNAVGFVFRSTHLSTFPTGHCWVTKLHAFRAILIVLSVACVAGALVSAPVALMTAVMAFDAPGSKRLWWVWAASLAMLSIPLWFVAGAVLGWVLHLRGWMLASLALAAAPLIAAAVVWSLLFD